MEEVLLLNPEVYNHVYDNLALVPLLCQKNLVHPLPLYYVNRNHISTSWSSKWSFYLALPYNALFVYMFMSVVVAAARNYEKLENYNKSLRLGVVWAQSDEFR